MQERQEQFELDLRLQLDETLSNVSQDILVELGTNRAAVPQVVAGAEFIVEPQRRVTVSHVRHIGKTGMASAILFPLHFTPCCQTTRRKCVGKQCEFGGYDGLGWNDVAQELHIGLFVTARKRSS